MKKKTYSTPSVECIKLDNEISLQLQSVNPPEGPGDETSSTRPEYMNNDPFKDHLI